MLTKRLMAVKDAVGKCDTLFDVGTDHGYVPISLIMDKKVKYAVASDVNQGPIENAKKNIDNMGLGGVIETRISDGISSMRDNEADVVVIAGMGGILISKILDKDIKKSRTVKTFILQPMNSSDVLRKYLYENDFKIIKEIAVSEDDKVYNILKVVNEKDKAYEKESMYYIGRPELFDLDNNETRIYINSKKEQYGRALEGLLKAENKDYSKINLYKEIIELAEEFYESK